MKSLSRVSLSFAKILLPLLFLFSIVQADNPLGVVINEIAWMGTESSYSDEWIELYNNSSSEIDLTGWKLINKEETLLIELEGKIPAKGFFLLERSDDETLPDIKADLTYKGSLNNKGEHLKLIAKEVIDEIDCSSQWFTGDNKTKRTMERTGTLTNGNNPENWQNSQDPGGTPKAENRARQKASPPEVSRELTTYPSGIIISKILPSPEGPDTENEWIEIFNENDKEVDLSGWQIVDSIGRTKVFIIPQGTKISAKGFLVFDRPLIKITLNNDGDTIKLLQPNGNPLDTVIYEKAPLGQVYTRIESGWEWSSILTPETIMPQIEEENGSFEAKFLKEEPISNNYSTNTIALPIALGLSLLSGITILGLKKKIRQKRF